MDKDKVLNVLAGIIDPELHISIVELGLIYDVTINPDPENTDKYSIEIVMTLTSPGCPIGPQLQAAVHHRVEKMEEVSQVKVNLVFTPPWDPREHASEDAQMELGLI